MAATLARIEPPVRDFMGVNVQLLSERLRFMLRSFCVATHDRSRDYPVVAAFRIRPPESAHNQGSRCSPVIL